MKGHIFADRFKSIIVQRGFHLVNVSRYIHLLPVTFSLIKDPQKYFWSSLSSYFNSTEKSSFLYTHDILNWFTESSKNHKQFLANGLKNKRKIDIVEGSFIGNPSFVKKIKKILRDNINYKENRKERIYREGYLYAEELLNQYCEKLPFDPDDLKNGHRRIGKIHNIHMEIILLLRKNTEWTFQQIADYFHISRVYAQSLYKKVFIP